MRRLKPRLLSCADRDGFARIGADVEPKAAEHLGEASRKWILTMPSPGRTVLSTPFFQRRVSSISKIIFHFLERSWRILRPGGWLLITTPNTTALRSRVRFFGSGFFGRDSRPLNESARHPFIILVWLLF